MVAEAGIRRGSGGLECTRPRMTDNPYEPQPDPLVTQPRSRPLRAQGYNLPPGPGRRMHHRHFARQEGLGFLLMLAIVGVVVYFVGWDSGLWRALFGGE